jgi:4-hydroxythreonine-4-phosphate dehydrogenase
MRSKQRIFSLTTGDIDGIGYEVSVKALVKKRLSKTHTVILWRSAHCLKKYSKLLNKHYQVEIVEDYNSALDLFSGKKSPQIVEIVSEDSPAFWVEKSAQLCLNKKIDAIVTGPLSKGTIYAAGLQDMGHTGILARVAKTKDVYMTFLGSKFNVVCVTGHIPINSVEKLLTTKKIESALSLALKLRSRLAPNIAKFPIGLLGLNPHAGEDGLIGNFEINLKKLISTTSVSNEISGPLVPDAAFLKSNWNKYSIHICLYHDQGLIPFKLVHGQNSGAHYSLGLPFIRTSVDHGTAKDIFNKDLANCNSMCDAIKWADRLLESN